MIESPIESRRPRPSNAAVERVAHCLAAIDNANAAASPRQHSVALCVIDRLAEPRAVVGVIASGERFVLEADEVDLAARVLADDQPIAGARLISGLLLARLGQAELLRFRANAIRMMSPMGRG